MAAAKGARGAGLRPHATCECSRRSPATCSVARPSSRAAPHPCPAIALRPPRDAGEGARGGAEGGGRRMHHARARQQVAAAARGRRPARLLSGVHRPSRHLFSPARAPSASTLPFPPPVPRPAPRYHHPLPWLPASPPPSRPWACCCCWQWPLPSPLRSRVSEGRVREGQEGGQVQRKGGRAHTCRCAPAAAPSCCCSLTAAPPPPSSLPPPSAQRASCWRWPTPTRRRPQPTAGWPPPTPTPWRRATAWPTHRATRRR